MINPSLWISIPFRDSDAWYDFLAQHDRWHFELAKKTKTRWYPLDDLRESLGPHARLHNVVADALGLPQVNDLESFDLHEEASYQSWQLLNAQDHGRLMLAAGIV